MVQKSGTNTRLEKAALFMTSNWRKMHSININNGSH